jgi:hypothetical protein
MSSKEENKQFIVELFVDGETWYINETDGNAKSSFGYEIFKKILFQSELTSIFLDQILYIGNCDLPTLEQSINQHVPLIQSLKNHWNKNMDFEIERVPIT